MDTSPYQPPSARLLPEHEAAAMFYVVSVRKFWVLMIATFGYYTVYWFYRHWKACRIHQGRDLWPIPRAVFAIFFTHELFRAFSKAAVDHGVKAAPALGGWATLFVVARIIQSLLFQATRAEDAHVALGMMELVSWLFVAWPLAIAQGVANAACGDPHGSENARFGLANGIWILLGIAGWSLVGLGLWLISGGVPARS